MDPAILKVLSAEVRRRPCPGCGLSLRGADVAADFRGGDQITIRFRCGVCVFEGGGEIALTEEMYAEARRSPALDRLEPGLGPITADEMLTLHEFLQAWDGTLARPAGSEPLP